VKLVNQNEIF